MYRELITKSQWRGWAKATRQTLAMEALSDQVVAQLVQWPVFVHARTVLTFRALPGELDLRALEVAFPKKNWYLPKVVGPSQMAFYPAEEPLVQSAWGLWEPEGQGEPLDASTSVDLVLVPALAVDRMGTRLGFGKGYYDRFLASLKTQPVLVCPMPSALVVPVLPKDAWDKPVHWVATEAGVISVDLAL